MAEGRSRLEWSQTASVMALLANIHRDPKSHPFEPADFDPWAKQERLRELREFVRKYRRKKQQQQNAE